MLSAILLLPRFIDILVERTLTQELISCLLASEIPMFLTKAIAVKVRKQHWIDFQAVATPQPSRVNANFVIKVQYPGSHSVGSPVVSKNFQDRPGITGSFLQRKVVGTWGFCLVSPCDYALEKKWQPTPIFLPGESQGQRSLVGCRLWGCTVRHD